MMTEKEIEKEARFIGIKNFFWCIWKSLTVKNYDLSIWCKECGKDITIGIPECDCKNKVLPVSHS